MTSKEIIALLPFQEPFLFVDELTDISVDGMRGSYTFSSSAFFYQGHFRDHPITPGVILTETMAQIGVVCLGIYIIKKEKGEYPDKSRIALTSHQIDFYHPVMPGEKVMVVSEKVYFRFHKLKCKVAMYNQQDELVCRGTIAGMINPQDDE
ncbi:MAG: hydroxymyristoyl-ACP dehydratase [Cyclobacteriaceae bacterium]|nr:hydroxymyristoyl-ACP dehydratase [Cyclobacteriaceae bacterium]